jgi:hypothetical protein
MVLSSPLLAPSAVGRSLSLSIPIRSRRQVAVVSIKSSLFARDQLLPSNDVFAMEEAAKAAAAAAVEPGKRQRCDEPRNRLHRRSDRNEEVFGLVHRLSRAPDSPPATPVARTDWPNRAIGRGLAASWGC